MYDTLEYLAYLALRRYLNKQRKDSKSGGTAEVLKFRTASQEFSGTESDPNPEANYSIGNRRHGSGIHPHAER